MHNLMHVHLVTLMRLSMMAAVAALVLAASPAATERIVRVIDGDTVVTAGGGRVRLMGLDTPEKPERSLERDLR
jgi:endonuclease YncB( thermonuclease family)